MDPHTDDNPKGSTSATANQTESKKGSWLPTICILLMIALIVWVPVLILHMSIHGLSNAVNFNSLATLVGYLDVSPDISNETNIQSAVSEVNIVSVMSALGPEFIDPEAGQLGKFEQQLGIDIVMLKKTDHQGLLDDVNDVQYAFPAYPLPPPRYVVAMIHSD